MRYWKSYQLRRMDEIKINAQLLGSLFGGGKSKKEKVTQAEAVKILANPLEKFPNDVNYLNKDEVGNQLAYAKKWQKYNPNKPLPLTVWTKERANACLGEDPAAKRASLNDLLWKKYLELKASGVTVTLEHIRKMLEFDFIRSALYPNAIQLSERNHYERKNKLPYTVIDPDKPPPEWFTKELEKRGELEPILRKLRLFCGRPQGKR